MRFPSSTLPARYLMHRATGSRKFVPGRSFLLSLLLLLPASLFAQVTTTPTYPPVTSFLWGNTSVNAVGKTSFVSGTGFGYRYILPKNFDPNVEYPAIIYLHSGSENGTDNTQQLTSGNNTAHGSLTLVSTANPDNQTNYPCFYIAPQSPVGNNWSTDSATTAIQNLLTIFKTQYPTSFDTTRIYLTGASDGAIGSYDLPYNLGQSNHLGANPFAAIVVMSGELGYYFPRAIATEPYLPIWVFHGAMDTVGPIAQSADVDVPALRSLGFSVIYSRYATGQHDIWELAYQHPLILPWFFAQKLGQAVQPLSSFAITGASQPTSTSLSLSGTASTAEAFTGLTWSDAANGQSGALAGSITPTWNIPSIPVSASTDPIQVTASAPNNTALLSGVATDYGGTMTVNLPYPGPASTSFTNVALNKTVTVSSVENSSLGGANAVDGNTTTTRWSSAFSDPQWIVVDLGASYAISEVDLFWEAACGKNYLIQTSNDNATWTTQTTVTGNTTSGLLVYSYATAPVARYIRVYGTARATPYGYSLYEVGVYSSSAATTPPVTPPVTPPTTATNVALGKTVTVSSTESTGTPGAYAVDGSTTTRWSSLYSDPQWIDVDLGSYYDISEVDLTWETAAGKNYQIQTSTDNVNWTPQTTVTGNTSTDC